MGIVPQNVLEWAALQAGLVPKPLAYAHLGFMMSKFLLEAVDKGVFEAIGYNKLSLNEIAASCQLNKKALQSLLGVLASMNLVDTKNDLFFLTRQSKKWLLKDSPGSMYWLLMFDNRVCFKWMDCVGDFLETGKGLQYHDTFTGDDWFYYQKAMEAAATATSKEARRKLQAPPGAVKMLDIGGAHGLYSVELCKKYPGLTSHVLDLAPAVEKARPILQKFNMGTAVQHIAGDILTFDPGKDQYDFVLMASLAHHFTAEENLAVAQKVYNALKPGGYFTIIEVLRHNTIKLNGDMLSNIGNMFFALSSTSGTWSLNEIKGWLHSARFSYHKKRTFLSIPGYVAVTGKK